MSSDQCQNVSDSESDGEPTLKMLQRELADSIIQLKPVNDLRILLACGAKVNEPVEQGLYPLHYAVHRRYESAVKLLLVRGCNVDAMDDVGFTALHICAERGYYELLELLITHGARVKFTEIKPEDNALGNPPRATLADEPLRLSIRNGHMDCAELLLKSGADPNAKYFLGFEINLISSLNVLALELLLKHGANPDSRDRTNLTPLMKACRHQQGYAAAKILLFHNANVNAITTERFDFRSVLHYSVLSNNMDITRLLLHHGANARYMFPSPALQKPTPLDIALLSGNAEMVKLLIDSGADVNVGSPIIGLSLHIALSENTPNKSVLVDLLLEAGADPNAITSDIRGPLLKPPIGEYFNSNERPNVDIIRKLLKHGARIVIKSQVQDELGILKVLNRLHPVGDREVLDLILESVESFNLAAIRRCPLLKEDSKAIILKKLQIPLPLAHLCRLKIRKLIEIVSKETNSAQHNARKQFTCPLLEMNQEKIRNNKRQTANDSNVDNGADCEEFDFTPEQLQHINQLTIDEIEDEFIAGVQNDDYRLRMFAYLIRRASLNTEYYRCYGAQVAERIEKLPLPDVVKKYLNYEISFASIHDMFIDDQN